MRGFVSTPLLPVIALACGGFFCTASPVDQSAERIIFVQEDAETVTSYVEITYQGEPQDFAWIVPVPSVPELDVWHAGAFNALDAMTSPRVWGDECFEPEPEPESEPEGGAGGGGPAPAPGVDVLAREQVGPFDTVTIASDDPRALIEWLRTNDFRVLPEMEPFIGLYTADNMKFVAMKLQPGEGIDAIAPIKMRYRARNPAVPLRLTAVAAQPDMGVRIWLLGDERAGPINVPALDLDESQLRADWYGKNYLPLVSRTVDRAGGRGFITEFAGSSAPLAERTRNAFVPERAGQQAIDARDALTALLDSKPYVTRLFTRLNPEEMDIDPVFGAAPGDDFDGVFRVPADGSVCRAPEGPDPCLFTECGPAGACATVEFDEQPRAGCVCADGALARLNAVGFVWWRSTATCVDVRLNFTAPDRMAEVPDPLAMASGACDGDPCGESGECIPFNGSQSCACMPGFAATSARIGGRAIVTCAPVIEEPGAPAAPREPDLPYPGRPAAEPEAMPVVPGNGGPGMAASEGDGCRAAPGRSTGLGALLVFAVFGLRRRCPG